MYRWKALRGHGRPVSWGPVLVGGCAALLAAAVVSVVVGRVTRGDAVTTAVTSCGLGVPGAALVDYRLTNGDRAIHSYRVHVSVASGRTVLGSGTSLVTDVAGGATSHARALVPVVASAAGGTCEVHAEVFDVGLGHHRSN
jgi:hypothetical protein